LVKPAIVHCDITHNGAVNLFTRPYWLSPRQCSVTPGRLKAAAGTNACPTYSGKWPQ
jgi:hypothetical protein